METIYFPMWHNVDYAFNCRSQPQNSIEKKNYFAQLFVFNQTFFLLHNFKAVKVEIILEHR